MNQDIRRTPFVFRSLLLAVALFFCIHPSITYGQWVWDPVTPISQIENGCCDGQVVVVEGRVTEEAGYPESWKIYEFTDGRDTTLVNFEDNLPDSAIIRNTTVRIMGVVDQGDWFTDINVSGVQTLGTLPVQVTATAAQVNSGSLDDRYVVLEGRVGNQLREPIFPSQWNVYEFTDSTGTTALDFENELRSTDIPNITLLVSGTVDDYFPRKVEDPTMFVGAGTPANQFNLTVNRAGSGSGAVTSSPTGIDCGSSCTAAFDSGTSVTLTAAPAFGSELSGWSGCNQTQANTCTVEMSAAKTVTATFTGGGSTSGEWIWDPVTPISQIENGCCDETTVVVEGKIVRKSAFPEEWKIYEFTDGTNITFVNFEDNVPDNAIILNTTVRIIGVVDQGDLLTDISVAGLQTQGAVPLQATTTAADVNSGREIGRFVVLEGKIKNQIFSSFPAEWNVYEFTDNTATTGVDFEDELQLRAKDFPQEVILVSGSGDDTIPRTLEDSTMWVGSSTPPEKYKLTVTKSGDGFGTVTSVPALIDCGNTCEASFDEGTTVTLTATADPGSKFDGWIDCNDTQANKCTVEITQKKLVKARFIEGGSVNKGALMLLLF